MERRITPGHAVFALAMIVLGVMSFSMGDFAQIWAPVPASVPARGALVYLTAAISLGCGIGLLWPRVSSMAARVLLAALVIWLVTLRAPFLFFEKPLVLVAWSFGSTAVMAAGAWVLYARLAGERDRGLLTFVTSEKGLRLARALYGVSLIPFGLAHFMYLDATTVLIPSWLQWPAAWAYLTGAAFILAGLAAIADVFAWLAISLSALQMAGFALVVWIPRLITGRVTAFQRGEAVATFVLAAGALVVAESCREKDYAEATSGLVEEAA